VVNKLNGLSLTSGVFSLRGTEIRISYIAGTQFLSLWDRELFVLRFCLVTLRATTGATSRNTFRPSENLDNANYKLSNLNLIS